MGRHHRTLRPGARAIAAAEPRAPPLLFGVVATRTAASGGGEKEIVGEKQIRSRGRRLARDLQTRLGSWVRRSTAQEKKAPLGGRSARRRASVVVERGGIRWIRKGERRRAHRLGDQIQCGILRPGVKEIRSSVHFFCVAWCGCWFWGWFKRCSIVIMIVELQSIDMWRGCRDR